MTLEKLRELKLVSNSDGRPPSDLTDEKWQKEFELRKLFLTPYPDGTTKLTGRYSTESHQWNEEDDKVYDGCTAYQTYVAFINDTLLVLRSNAKAYCFYIYQIEELAKFDFGNKTLKTKYCGGYWEVWLD